jgi:hypothetical protein
MKKTILGALITSTCVISGDLAKCTEAIEMQEKYFDTKVVYKEKYLDSLGKTSKLNTIEYKNKHALYSQLYNRWIRKAELECKDILDGTAYKSVSSGNFFLTTD